jgi:hypothetical protein
MLEAGSRIFKSPRFLLLLMVDPAISVEQNCVGDWNRSIAESPFAIGEQLLGYIIGDVLGTMASPGETKIWAANVEKN